MLTIWGAKQQQRFCDGVTRRNFLKIGAFGAGLSLADMMRLRAAATGTATPSKTSKKSAIMIYLEGGPSHIDTYDLKPEAPVEYRGKYKPIATNVPGVQICELFPLQARMWDKLSCIRSIVTAPDHSDSELGTGYREAVNSQENRPSFGAVVSKLRGASNGGVPPFVSLRGLRGILGPGRGGLDPGYLGVAHRAFAPDVAPNGSAALGNLGLAKGVSMARLEDRKSLLASFDSLRRDIDASGTMTGWDSFASRSFDMITSGTMRKALDLTREDARSRERYKGVEMFLIARRLVEVGVDFVTLRHGAWDTHNKHWETLDRQLPEVDRGVANLVQDLCDRGMDQDVVTIMWGEFGRNPKLGAGEQSSNGRDHWPMCMSALVAGGGLKMGQMVGESTARAERPKDRPYRVQQVLSTLYQVLGIDPAQTFPNGSGRPMYILDDRDPVRDLL